MDDILALDYKLDISYFLFTEQWLIILSYILYSALLIMIEETIMRQQAEENIQKETKSV